MEEISMLICLLIEEEFAGPDRSANPNARTAVSITGPKVSEVVQLCSNESTAAMTNYAKNLMIFQTSATVDSAAQKVSENLQN